MIDQLKQYMNFSIAVVIVAFLFNIYVLYLNWKQSKVKEEVAEMNETLSSMLIEIREINQSIKAEQQ